MSNSDYMTEWELKKAKEQTCGQRLLEAVQNEIRDISEQVVDLAREKQDEISGDFKNLWDAICFQVARGDPADFASYGDCIRRLCSDLLDERGDLTTTVIALWYDTFGPADLRDVPPTYIRPLTHLGDDPPYSEMLDWAVEAIYSSVIENAGSEVKSGFLSYDRNDLDSLLFSLRGLIPLAKTGADLIGLGKAIESVEKIRAGKRSDCSLHIGCYTFDEADEVDREWARVHIDSDGIILSVLEESYDGFHGSREFPFSDDFSSWRTVFDRVRKQRDVALGVEVNS